MTTQLAEYQQLLTRARSLEPELRLTMAEELLRSLHGAVRPVGLRGVPAAQVRGLAAGSGPPPDDETLRRWLEEHRVEKYG
jgi:hypothetical protein